MKITRIEKIKNYGIFCDYNRTDVKDFGDNNIIFGWNYSGKTTLSRIFRSIEKKEPHPDYSSGKFKLICDDDSEIKENAISNNSLKIRVFNSDYIKENLRWDQAVSGIPPILMVGEDSIKLQEKIEQLKKDNDIIQKKLTIEVEKKSTKESNLNSALTNEATRITSELSLGRTFRKPDLETLINNVNITKWILSDFEFLHKKAIAQGTNKLDAIEEISITPDKDILDSIKEILLKTATPSKTIERLKNNLAIENWVREGRLLHRDKNTCEFCSNKLPSGFLSDLDAHFSKDYEGFRKEVAEFDAILENKKLFADLKTKNDFYKEFQEDYLLKKKELEKEINNYNQTIDKLLILIRKKVSYLSKAISVDEQISINSNAIELKVNAFNEVIKANEQKTAKFDKIKQDAISLLKNHYASKFYLTSKFENKKTEIQAIEKQIQLLSGQIELINSEILSIEGQISESVKGAVALNDFLKRYFGHDTPLEIKALNDRFHIYRGDIEAKNLSEGEKTAISFSYFLTRLNDKDTNANLKEFIVYIDDPISSLDNNHLFNTFSLIATYLKDQCGQLFISTHNFEFFNLMKDLFKPPKDNKCSYNKKQNNQCNSNIYFIERLINNALLKNIDCLLCHFRSEYLFLFYQLHNIFQTPDPIDDYKLYAAPNILRRFLETYSSFTYRSAPK